MAHIYRRGVSAIGEEPERTEKKRKDTEKMDALFILPTDGLWSPRSPFYTEIRNEPSVDTKDCITNVGARLNACKTKRRGEKRKIDKEYKTRAKTRKEADVTCKGLRKRRI